MDKNKAGPQKSDPRRIIYRFIARLDDFGPNRKNTVSQTRLSDFIQYLYFQNSGREKELKNLYKSTKRAILSWDGQFGDDCICIDHTNDHLWILEELKIGPAFCKHTSVSNGTIQRFSPSLVLRFQSTTSAASEPVALDMDFALYELVSDLEDGYRPTAQDKNCHADFAGFVQRLIEFGNKSQEIVLIPKNGDQTYRMVFEKTMFDEYEFKVV